MTHKASAIVELFVNEKITEDEAISLFQSLLKSKKQLSRKRDHHDITIEEISTIDGSLVKYRAVCKRCGLKSYWFKRKGLAESNLDMYFCE